MIGQERTSSSLDDRLRDSDNALNFLRLVLAVSVIAAHAWPLGGYGEMPSFGGMSVGSWAVAGFFALSGYLIAGSRMQSGLSAFFWKRLLRLMPGFWVCLLVVAFVFAPISTRLMVGSEWTPAAAMEYVTGNAFLNISERGIAGTLPARRTRSLGTARCGRFSTRLVPTLWPGWSSPWHSFDVVSQPLASHSWSLP